MAWQIARINRYGDLRLQQFGMDQGAFGKLGQQAGGQVVDAIEAAVLQYCEGGTFA
ncbi:hypothetical protein D9M73_243780 [compost metagenome]